MGTVIVFNQIEFTKDRPIGYDRSNLISIQMNNPEYNGKYNLLRNELINTGVVEDMTQSSSPLMGVYSNGGGGISWEGKDPEMSPDFGILRVTHDYGNTVGWQFVEGRDFSRDYASDSSTIILNETAVKYMGLENPVGSFITFGNDDRAEIIGVTKDMVMQSPYNPVKQAFFYIDYDRVDYINIKIKPDAIASDAIARIEEVFAKVVPSAQFDYGFVDEAFGQKFESEERLGNLAATNQGNRGSKSVGGIGFKFMADAFQRFCDSCTDFLPDCDSYHLLLYESVVTELRLPYGNICMDLWLCHCWRIAHYPIDGKLPSH